MFKTVLKYVGSIVFVFTIGLLVLTIPKVSTCPKSECYAGRIEYADSSCNGTGRITRTIKEDCSKCRGRGVIDCEYYYRYFKEIKGFYIDLHDVVVKGPNGKKGWYITEYCKNGYLKGGADEGSACPRCGGRTYQNCNKCDGYGYKNKSRTINCSNCGGDGKLEKDCPCCDGLGKVSLWRKYLFH